jgi:hypothetical protein
MASLIVEMITNTRCIIIIFIISNIPRSCNNGSLRYSPFRNQATFSRLSSQCLKDDPRSLSHYFRIRIIHSILQLEKIELNSNLFYISPNPYTMRDLTPLNSIPILIMIKVRNYDDLYKKLYRIHADILMISTEPA